VSSWRGTGGGGKRADWENKGEPCLFNLMQSANNDGYDGAFGRHARKKG